jgi:hypothetical protein
MDRSPETVFAPLRSRGHARLAGRSIGAWARLGAVALLVSACGGARATAPARIMTFDEYARAGDPATPPVVHLLAPRGGGELLYLGFAHTFDPADAQIAALEGHWKAFAPTVAFNEGGSPPAEADAATAVSRHGESGLLRFLGARDHVEVRDIEPPRDVEIAELTPTFTLEQLKTFYVLRQVAHYRDAHMELSLEEYVAKTIRSLEKRPALTRVPPRAIGELDAETRALLPARDGFRSVTDDDFDPVAPPPRSLTQAISRRAAEVRDTWVVRSLIETVTRGERVLAVMGESHVVMQQPALRGALREAEPPAPARR